MGAEQRTWRGAEVDAGKSVVRAEVARYFPDLLKNWSQLGEWIGLGPQYGDRHKMGWEIDFNKSIQGMMRQLGVNVYVGEKGEWELRVGMEMGGDKWIALSWQGDGEGISSSLFGRIAGAGMEWEWNPFPDTNGEIFTKRTNGVDWRINEYHDPVGRSLQLYGYENKPGDEVVWYGLKFQAGVMTVEPGIRRYDDRQFKLVAPAQMRFEL